MTDPREMLAAHGRAGQADLERLLRARDRDEIARLMWCLLRWHRELLPLAEAYDPAMVAYLKPLRPKPEELIRIWGRLNSLPIGRQRGLCNATEAALVRVNDALMRRPDARPKGKGGNRPTYNDEAIVGKARAIRGASGTTSKAAAVREAMRCHPELFKGRGTDESTAKRIARQM